MFHERWYQEECAAALFKDITEDVECHPIGVVPTGGGKTAILCKLIDLILSANPVENILVLSHVSEILEQNHESLQNYFGETFIGLYSSGLKTREIKKITVAGIQSIHKKIEEFSDFGVVIVDECHLITIKESGMYRSFLDAMVGSQVCGLTATHFRTGHGYIHEGEGALFNKLSYDLSSPQNFARLQDEGFLSKLFSKPTAVKLETDGIKTVAGDFSQKQLSANLDRDNITEAIVMESLHFGKKYKKWLCFAIDIDHAENIKRRFLNHGISCEVVHSKMKRSRKDVINDYKNGKYKLLINVNVLTTGFDVPDIDLIIMMRPTKSPIIHVQTIGRGLRVVYKEGHDISTVEGRLAAIADSDKTHCLVLDFAGNTSRLGPIDNVEVQIAGKGKGDGEAITKDCPECSITNHAAARNCINCDFEFVFKEKLQLEASTQNIVSGAKALRVPDNEKSWADVDGIHYERRKGFGHVKDKVQVIYHCGLTRVREQIDIEGVGYPRHIAVHWIDFRWDYDQGSPPETVRELLESTKYIRTPKRILVDRRGKYDSVEDAEF